MSSRKPLPNDITDKRRVYPIDELRVKYWLNEVKKNSGCNTEYALAKKFGGTQSKWKNYKTGSQPNENVLDEVNVAIANSRNWYTCGPKDLKLWPSLSIHLTLNELSLISEFSNQVDAKIVQFRLDAVNSLICPKNIIPDDIYKTFDIRAREIEVMLDKVVEKQFASEVINILKAIVYPLADEKVENFNNDLMDFIMDSKYTKSDVSKMIREAEFESLELPTIKNKGQRKFIHSK